jgi:Isochorismatase family
MTLHRFGLLAATLFILGALSHSGDQFIALNAKSDFERTLSKGSSDYSIALAAKESALIIVRQEGVDVVIDVTAPDGSLLDSVDSPTGRYSWLKPVSPQKENAMNNQVRLYEPLTSQNAALVLVDHQVGLMTGVRDYSTGELKHNVVALAKAAKALKLPIVVTTTARDSMWGPTFPELVEALSGIEIIDRSSVNAFDDARVTRAIEATGRKKLIFAGISLEVCAAFPAITAVGKGLDADVAR